MPLFSKNAGAGAPSCKLQLWFRHNVRDQELPTSDFSVIVSFSFVSLNFFSNFIYFLLQTKKEKFVKTLWTLLFMFICWEGEYTVRVPCKSPIKGFGP